MEQFPGLKDGLVPGRFHQAGLIPRMHPGWVPNLACLTSNSIVEHDLVHSVDEYHSPGWLGLPPGPECMPRSLWQYFAPPDFVSYMPLLFPWQDSVAQG